jgi:large subunit ribosomal protein L1
MSKHKERNSFDLEESLKKVLDLSNGSRKFLESIDIAVNLGIDPKQSDQIVKGSVVLPKGSGRKVKVLVFAADDKIKNIALEAGASFAGLEDLISKIENGFLDFDYCISTADIMQKISKISKKLGPRGLMPSPKNGTVTNDVKKAVEDAIKGKIDFKTDKSGIIHCLIGKANFSLEDLMINLKAIIKAIKDSKPESSKGKFIKDLYISSTMGLSIKVSAHSL